MFISNLNLHDYTKRSKGEWVHCICYIAQGMVVFSYITFYNGYMEVEILFILIPLSNAVVILVSDFVLFAFEQNTRVLLKLGRSRLISSNICCY